MKAAQSPTDGQVCKHGLWLQWEGKHRHKLHYISFSAQKAVSGRVKCISLLHQTHTDCAVTENGPPQQNCVCS